jgi:hypothetical protein
MLDPIWPQAEPLLKRAVILERGRYTTRDIYQWIQANEQQLWVVMRGREVIAAALLRCSIHPAGKRSAALHLLAGKPGAPIWEWIDVFAEAAMAEARARGTSEFVVVGRRGWARLLKRYGFHYEATVLVHDEV